MIFVPIGPGRALNIEAVEEIYDDGEHTCIRTVSGHCTRITDIDIACDIWRATVRQHPRHRGLLSRLLSCLGL